MKHFFTIALFVTSIISFAQTDKARILEKRARELHKAIVTTDKEAWKKYMVENFTQALIDRPMRAKVVVSENDNTSATSTANTENAIEEKLTMFERLHHDFGQGKIKSVKVEGDSVEMTLITDGGLTGVFRFDAEAKSPWLIDKLGIEVEMNK